MISKEQKKDRRHRRIRVKIVGIKTKPRLYVFRSNRHVYAQLVNDENGKIMASVSDLKMKGKKGSKIDIASEIGKLIAQKAKDLKIEKIVFDRGGYKYHGRIKALAEASRKEGLKF